MPQGRKHIPCEIIACTVTNSSFLISNLETSWALNDQCLHESLTWKNSGITRRYIECESHSFTDSFYMQIELTGRTTANHSHRTAPIESVACCFAWIQTCFRDRTASQKCSKKKGTTAVLEESIPRNKRMGEENIRGTSYRCIGFQKWFTQLSSVFASSNMRIDCSSPARIAPTAQNNESEILHTEYMSTKGNSRYLPINKRELFLEGDGVMPPAWHCKSMLECKMCYGVGPKNLLSYLSCFPRESCLW